MRPAFPIPGIDGAVQAECDMWFPPNRGGFLYAASRMGAAVFS